MSFLWVAPQWLSLIFPVQVPSFAKAESDNATIRATVDTSDFGYIRVSFSGFGSIGILAHLLTFLQTREATTLAQSTSNVEKIQFSCAQSGARSDSLHTLLFH